MMQLISRLATALVIFVSINASAATLPAVTGLVLNDNEFSWDAQEGATGYNIYSGFAYYATVSDGTSFELVEPGSYTVVSFNDQGEFSVFPPPADGETTTFVVYTGAEPLSTSYNLYGTFLFVSSTCTNVGPGDSCAARCPINYDNGNGGQMRLISATGGACSTSDIVEADAFVQPLGYNCAVPTFSGEVVAQAVCSYRR